MTGCPQVNAIFNVDSIMENIHCAFCDTYIELLAAIYQIRELLQENPRVCEFANLHERFLVKIIFLPIRHV